MILVACVAVFALWLLWGYTDYRGRLSKIKTSREALVNVLNMRHQFVQDLFKIDDSLIDLLDPSHPSEALKRLAEMPVDLDSEYAMAQENALAHLLGEIFEYVEPVAIEGPYNYINLRDKAKSIEDEINAFTRRFNDNVVEINTSLRQPPLNFLAGWLKIEGLDSVKVKDALRHRKLKFVEEPEGTGSDRGSKLQRSLRKLRS